MKITIDQEVFKKFHPKLRMGFVVIDGADNHTNVEESAHLLKDMCNAISLMFNKESVKSHHLLSPWNVVKEEFKGKAKHYNTSVEKLMKKVVSKRSVIEKNCLSNIASYCALKHIVPIVVDDLARVDSQIIFSMSSGRERKGLLGKVKESSLYYSDKEGVLGVKLDYWRSPRSKVSNFTTYALFHIAFLPPVTREMEKKIMSEVVQLVEMFCQGDIQSVVLDKEFNSMEF